MALDAEGRLSVNESITAQVRGKQIRRFMTRRVAEVIQLPEGDTHRVGYEIEEIRVERLHVDGYRETVFVPDDLEDQILRPRQTVRIRAGDTTRALEPGRYVFRFGYTVHRSFRDSDNQARLYWPVTGRRSWPLDIDHIEVKLSVPDPIDPKKVEITAFDRWPGEPEGVLETDVAEVSRDRSGAVIVTRPEGVESEGEFAFEASWPSGIVQPSSIPIDWENELKTLFAFIFFIGWAGVLVFVFIKAWPYLGSGGGSGAGGPGGGGGGGAGGGGGGGG